MNANDRLHWRPRNDRTQAIKDAVIVLVRQQRLPRLERARIICHYRPGPRQRRRDPANWAPSAKAAVDGLVAAGVLDDDDHTRVVGPDMRLGPVDEEARRRGTRYGRLALTIVELPAGEDE
ncbi:hypothetical protein [Actinomadura yumaensis]|uniref:RusA-like resolvase n=1 Tax=Actinomadura yumaensis TaxID=111807 RepID=A0ABW2CR54_9ACTN